MAIIGAILGGVSAAVNGGNVGIGILAGFVGGGIAGIGFDIFAETANIGWAIGGGILGGAASSGISGGNVGYGALTGGIAAGLGAGLGFALSDWGSDIAKFGAGLVGAAAIGAGVGGLGAELSGGRFGEGAGMGAAFASAGFLAYRAVLASSPDNGGNKNSGNTQQAQDVLTVDENADTIVVEYSRPLNNWVAKFLGIPRHKFATYNEGQNLFEIENEPGKNGSIINVRNLKGQEVNDYLNKWAGQLKFREVGVNSEAFQGRMTTYTAKYNGQPYDATSYNSNYAVNFVIYGKAEAPGGLGWCPPFAKDD